MDMKRSGSEKLNKFMGDQCDSEDEHGYLFRHQHIYGEDLSAQENMRRQSDCWELEASLFNQHP